MVNGCPLKRFGLQFDLQIPVKEASMRNIYLVIKNEIVTTLGKRSFWVMTFLFPGLILGLSVGMQTVGTRAIQKAEETASSLEGTNTNLPIGYVDKAGVVDTLPEWVPEGYLKSFSEEDLAKTALQSGSINQYTVIPENFYETGEFILVDRNFQPLRSSGNGEIFENIINDAMMKKEILGVILQNPTSRVNAHAISPDEGLDTDDPLSYIIPMASLFIFFFVITTSSGFMLTSVSKEKENRTAETLLSSINPKHLMLGKVIGLGAIAIFQMTIWLFGASTALDNRGQLFSIASSYTLPSGFFTWAIVFFILGYFLYASILGTIGVLAPTAREGGQFTLIAILPLLVPLWFNYTFTEEPEGALTLFLSLFPLTAPHSMITRIATSSVPLWQILLSLAGLSLTAYFFVVLSARFFKADNFLSNERLSWRRFFTGIRKR